MFQRIVYVAIAIVVLLIAWRGYAIFEARRDLAQAPYGNAAGPENADITIIEIMDYRCSYCREMAAVVKALSEKHPDVRIVFRHMPVFGLPSLIEAEFALAAGMQGKFMPAHDFLMARETPLGEDGIDAAAKGLGLDAERLKTDMKDPAMGDMLIRTVSAAETLGIRSTPAFLVNGKLLLPATMGRLPTIPDFEKMMGKIQ